MAYDIAVGSNPFHFHLFTGGFDNMFMITL